MPNAVDQTLSRKAFRVSQFPSNSTEGGIVVSKVVYPICCGMDVQKKFLVATIIKTEGITPTYLKKRFSTFNNQLRSLRDWLLENNCYDVCMESTGKYWIPIYNILEDHVRIT